MANLLLLEVRIRSLALGRNSLSGDSVFHGGGGFRENMNHSANRSVRLRRDATRLAIAFPEANAIFRRVQRRSDVVRRRYVVSANASFVAPIDTSARGRQLHRTTRSLVCMYEPYN